MAVINNLKSGGTKLPESVFYGFWIAEVRINNAAMGYNIYKIYDNDTMDVLEVTIDGTIQNDVKDITYTISGKVLTPNASAGTLTYQEDGTLYQLYNGQLPLTFTRKLFSNGALSVTKNGTYKPLIHNGYATVDVNVQGGDYDIEVTDNNDGTQSLAIVDSDSSIDRNETIRGLISGGLTEIVIPEGTTNIRSSAFYNCISLTSVTIPDSVTSIGSSAFQDCSSLTSITIPDSVTSIGGYAFYKCSELTGTLTIPENVTSIGSGAFHNCYSVTEINYNAINCADASSDYRIFYDVGRRVGTTLNIGINVERIPSYLFQGYSQNSGYPRIENVNFLGDKCTTIGISAFRYCARIQNINIPNGVTYIGNSAFQYCSGLTSITIPHSVTSLGVQVFQYCSKLTEMTILATTPPTLSNTNAISSATTKIYIPNGTLSAYQSATNWSSFASKFVELEV